MPDDQRVEDRLILSKRDFDLLTIRRHGERKQFPEPRHISSLVLCLPGSSMSSATLIASLVDSDE